MSRKFLYSFALFYLALPTVIFLLTWCNLWIGIPLALGILGVGTSLCSKFKGYTPIGSIAVVFGIAVVIALWITIAGIGGFMWQNDWDHSFRNALFIDLVNKPWPVIQGKEMLVYYLGYWLPAAGVAKIFGSLTLGWILQWIWAWIGIMSALWIIFDYIGKIKFSTLLLLIFVGSIDILPALWRNTGDCTSGILPLVNAVIENWGGLGFIEWPDVMVFWVYNQFIPSFLGCMLIFRCKDLRISVYAMSLLLLCAPFSEVLLAPIALMQLISLITQQRGLSASLRVIFSSTNILALLILMVIGTYITSNAASGSVHLNPDLFTPGAERVFYWKLLISLFIFSILPWILLNIRALSRDAIFYILLIVYMPCMMIVMGDGQDFLSRTALPLIFYLFLRLAKRVSEFKTIKSVSFRVCFFICITLSAVTPILDMARTIYQSAALPKEQWRTNVYPSIFSTDTAHDNFTGNNDNWIFSRTYHAVGTSLTEDVEGYENTQR